MEGSSFHFARLPISEEYGPIINPIFHVVKNRKSDVHRILLGLTDKFQDQIIDHVSKLATIENYRTKKIKRLTPYKYFELCIREHRFFFFYKDKNIIFFDYKKEEGTSLGSRTYRKLNEDKNNYEEQFERFTHSNQ